MHYLLYGLLWLITWLPLPILYLLSDFAYLIVYYFIGYRKKVVRQNLKNSFPDKSADELRKIEKKFYHHFCDVFIESIYEMHISKKEMLKRMNFIHLDRILEQYDNGKSCLLMTAHYGNWEWASGLSLSLPADKPLYGVYKRLTNKHFDDLMCELRMKSTGLNVEKNDLLRKMIQLRKDKQLAMFGMISDQAPSKHSINYWTTFLNQDTDVITGTEVLARKFDYPVFYSEIICVKRGYYDCEFIPVSLEPSKTSEFEITEKYMQMLEKTIQKQPEFWLWTHRRWKHKNKKLQPTNNL